MKRRNLPLSTLDAGGSPIAAALSLWRAARPRSGRLPARRAFDLGRVAELLDDAGWVTVTADRPARFSFHTTSPSARGKLGDFAAICRHGTALRDAARPVYDDYSAAAFTGVPMLHHLVPGEGEGAETLERLILPFAEDGVGVDGLLVCARRRVPANLH